MSLRHRMKVPEAFHGENTTSRNSLEVQDFLYRHHVIGTAKHTSCRRLGDQRDMGTIARGLGNTTNHQLQTLDVSFADKLLKGPRIPPSYLLKVEGWLSDDL
ncbi:hypothetical protein CEXT_207821 [Caerostris extrusa]|uniref:Uncharacterized protein n=1 Tax=Caerostris extrusa TaxID=172846 RepID=A0AAV4TIJ0_CAEEX|nr:hypothetical protein CEXT_207821 [Caerostris extrusa]